MRGGRRLIRAFAGIGSSLVLAISVAEDAGRDREY